jgi:hypothetical protein
LASGSLVFFAGLVGDLPWRLEALGIEVGGSLHYIESRIPGDEPDKPNIGFEYCGRHTLPIFIEWDAAEADLELPLSHHEARHDIAQLLNLGNL